MSFGFDQGRVDTEKLACGPKTDLPLRGGSYLLLATVFLRSYLSISCLPERPYPPPCGGNPFCIKRGPALRFLTFSIRGFLQGPGSGTHFPGFPRQPLLEAHMCHVGGSAGKGSPDPIRQARPTPTALISYVAFQSCVPKLRPDRASLNCFPSSCF
jgi:hypothetical protein